MKITPSDNQLQQYIEYYWIVKDIKTLTNIPTYVHSYPGITPELIIPVEGYLEYTYQGKVYQSNKAILYSFIHERIVSHLKTSPSFIVVTFKSRALASLLPFMKTKAMDLIKNPIVPAENILGYQINLLQNHWKTLNEKAIAATLDDWFLTLFQADRAGFITDVGALNANNASVQMIMNKTNYSYSTIERYFKKETGLTPKKYLCLRRFKAALCYFYNTNNTDWMDYVVRFGYHDQSHFIKDIKHFTGMRPTDLIQVPSLLNYRPDTKFLTNFYNEEK